MAYLSHISWVMPILALIPNEEMQQLSKFGLRVATERVNRGSSSKDLFYYLVGPSFQYSSCHDPLRSADGRRHSGS